MIILFLVLIVIAAVGLGFMVLVQNPKGGGLTGNVGGIGNQFMGVKQTTDVLEKGTWMFAGIIALLALFSTFFLKGGTDSVDNSIIQKINTNTTAPAQAPAKQQPANTVPATPAPTQK
jgi:preprotein translocase subunit SecG